MKFNIFLSLLLIIPFKIYAQKNATYQQKSDDIKNEVWGKRDPVFEIKSIPEKYSKESAVVIARSFDMKRNTAVAVFAAKSSTTRTEIFREKIKLNDKVALENYSTLYYDKIVDKSKSFLFEKFIDKREVFVGIKVTKPDGKEIIINPNEEVILANTSKDKGGKIAVPGLEVGDIIDYYMCTVRSITGEERAGENNYFFLLADEYHVLNYSYTFQFSKYTDFFYNSLNNAPKFVTTTETNSMGGTTLTLKGTDMLKLKREVWSSSLRELPYITVSSYFPSSNSVMSFGAKKPEDPSRLGKFIDAFQKQFDPTYYPFENTVQRITLAHYGSEKNFKSAPLDSSMKYFYNAWKFDTFANYEANDLNVGVDKNGLTANSKVNAIILSQQLADLEIPHDILLVSSRFSNALDDVSEYADFDAMIRVKGPTPIYLAFNTFSTPFNQLPAEYNGEKAVVLTPSRKSKRNYTFQRTEIVLPVDSASTNQTIETLNVNFVSDNLQKIRIKRNVKETGTMKVNDQLRLLLFEDMDNEIKELIGGRAIENRITGQGDKKKIKAALTTAFDTERANLKNRFTAEITENYEVEPKEVSDVKIINSSLKNDAPFEFESTFTLETLVKKAGSNYIVDIGKLIGTIVTLKEEDRTRNTDIYMPSARSLTYHITLNIPANYKVNGVNELAISESNAQGSIHVVPSLNGQALHLTVSRVYRTPFIKKEQWNEILKLIDTAQSFINKKVLLEKVK